MDITKSTLWGALALVILVVAVVSYRYRLESDSAVCRARLQQLAAPLATYAAAHNGQLPATPEALRQAVGALPVSTVDGKPYVLAATPQVWKRGAAQPYLWDPAPHPKINGIHVLTTDGVVHEVTSLDDLTP